MLFKYFLGYTATGLCIGYMYPIACPILAVYLLKDFEKEIDTFKKYGDYSYVFDITGNSIFNSNSENFNQGRYCGVTTV